MQSAQVEQRGCLLQNEVRQIMASSNTERNAATIREARKLIGDLMVPKQWVYWVDFLLSTAVGYTSALIYLTAFVTDPETNAWVPFQWYHALAFFVAGFALYRVSLMMHEIVHFKRGEMVAFKVAWNLLVGVVLLIPSFLYESHICHHNTHHYGTSNDGEYLPLGGGRFRNLVLFLLQIFLLPGLTAFRFLVITPISFLHPKLREWTLHHASSFVINFRHYREIPANAPLRMWAVMDVLCFLRTVCIFAGLALGVTEWPRIVMMYALAMFILGVNHVRTMVAHRYLSDGETMSHVDQLSDSINIEGNRLVSSLVCPVGLQYHALHHLFPTLPYHNLHAAHRRLMEKLPAGSPYHEATYPGFLYAFKRLVQSVRESQQMQPAPAELWYQSQRHLQQGESPTRDAEKALTA